MTETILFILVIAVAAPMLAEIPIGFRLPVVVIEMLLGFAIGPHALGLVGTIGPGDHVSLLGQAGLAFLFFLVGMEIDLGRFRGRPLTLALLSWGVSLALAAAAAALLYTTALVSAPVAVAIALTTTATGLLVPPLRDSGGLATKFGTLLLAAATLGELGPILVMAFVFTKEYSYPAQTALMLSFIVIVIVTAWAALRLRPPKVLQLLRRTLHATSQLPVRICMLLLTALMMLAAAFGLDMILGAFAAGMVVGLVSRDERGEILREKLDAIGYGYFVPFFFVTSGMKLDLGVLVQSTGSLLLVPFFLLLLLAVRGAPVVLYRNDLAKGETLPLALYCATTLPLVVAVTDIGVQTGLMHREVAAALVGAGILSTLVFPPLAGALLARAAPARPQG